MENFIKQPLNIIISILCFVIISYFGIKIYKELAPKSYKDKQLRCLELGSDYARRKCLDVIK
jgi:NADH:ubiquinone oxidoreductase subunit 3 (subunit A)